MTKLRSAFVLALAAADCASPPPAAPAPAPAPPPPTSSAVVEPVPEPMAEPDPVAEPPARPPARVVLPPAPAKLDQRIPTFGWLPPIADCAMKVEGEVGAIRVSTMRGTQTRPNPLAHPARVAKTLGKCDPTVQKAEVAKMKSQGSYGLKYAFFSAGTEIAAVDVAKSLLPLDTPEKAALHLLLVPGHTAQWYVGVNDEWISYEDPRIATAKCFGCTTLETKATPEGHAFLVLMNETLERAGCHQKIGIFRTMVVVAPDGNRTATARTQIGLQVPFCVGRAPEGYVARASTESEASYFAAMARDEAASIGSFERLARELRAHGAPEDLARRAERAADDERRHARMMASLAGIDDVAAFEPPKRIRSLEDVALENSVEGCVRETYAALVAHHQALHATSARVRDVMKRIADDETEHAELAHDVDTWARGRLPAPALERLDAAAEAAIRGLENAPASPFPQLDERCGNSRARAQALISTLRRLVWS